MERYIDALNNYIAGNAHKKQCPNANGILDMLFCCYRQQNGSDTVKIRACFAELDDILKVLSISQADRVADLACSLCDEHQKESWRYGWFYLVSGVAKEIGFCKFQFIEAASRR